MNQLIIDCISSKDSLLDDFDIMFDTIRGELKNIFEKLKLKLKEFRSLNEIEEWISEYSIKFRKYYKEKNLFLKHIPI